MKTYAELKEQARQKAIEWQAELANNECLSWAEKIAYTLYFESLARRYGLTKEFRENGII